MIWLITVPLAIAAAYAVLCLVIDTGTDSSSKMPYRVILLVSTAVLYVAWVHPVRITFS